MTAKDESFLRFVRAVRRRMGIVRAIEGAGIGAVAGSILGLGLMGALILRSDASLLPGALMVGLGAIAGLIWGAARQPGVMAAAAQADRQLHLQDLLTTALAARDSRDPWARSVVAMAAHRCASVHPRQVIFSRFGGRAWGGIATAAALTLAIALLAPRAGLTLAGDTSRAFVAARDLDRLPTPPAHPMLPSVQQPPTGGAAAPDRPTAIPMHSDDPAEARTGDAAVESPHQSEIANPHGAGSGQGRTDPRHDPRRLDVTPSDRSVDPQSGRVTGSGGGEVAGGNDSQSAGSHVASRSGDPAPPWQSDGWPAQRDAAIEAIQQNEIPAEYRDLIRAYFNRHE